MIDPIRFVRLPEVLTRTGLTRSTLYEMISRGQFPRQVKISHRSVAWRESEIDAWCQARAPGVSVGVSQESDAA